MGISFVDAHHQVFSIALVVTVSIETGVGGLGQHQSSLSDTDLAVFQKVDLHSLSDGD